MNLRDKMALLDGKSSRRHATSLGWVGAALFTILLISGTSTRAQAGQYRPPYLGVPCVDSGGQPGIQPSTIVYSDVFVPPGQGCTLTDVVVAGDINVSQGASYLNTNGAHIRGNIFDRGANSMVLGALQSAVAPVSGTTCPTGYTYDPNSTFCLFNDASAASSYTTVGGSFQGTGGGSLGLNGIQIEGNFQAVGLNSITTAVPPLTCPDGSVVIVQEAFVFAGTTSAFAIQQLLCIDGEAQISLNTDGYQSYLPGAAFNVGGSIQISKTQGAPPPSVSPTNADGSCPSGYTYDSSDGACISAPMNQICNAVVGGNLQLFANGSAAPFTIGNPPSSVFIDGSTPAALPCLSNTVVGSAQLVANQGAIMGDGNVIEGNLQCIGNNTAPTGTGNRVAGYASGQCGGGQFSEGARTR